MKKKVTISLLSFFLVAIAIGIVHKFTFQESESHYFSVSQANSFGNKEDDDKDNQSWIFYGEKGVKILQCYMKCDIESGGLVLSVYDHNGYTYLDKDKYVLVREEIIPKSGEYDFDFSDLPDGIYSCLITPQHIGDEAYFEYTVDYYEEEE